MSQEARTNDNAKSWQRSRKLITKAKAKTITTTITMTSIRFSGCFTHFGYYNQHIV